MLLKAVLRRGLSVRWSTRTQGLTRLTRCVKIAILSPFEAFRAHCEMTRSGRPLMSRP